MAASDPSPYVATPTGTLQGVAAFSWDGSAWQPSGRAGPSVATPTGVLQGVAPFSWDGASWQPAGRAQPGVAAPGGVLDGVAVYTWSGSAWTPTGGTATPTTPSGALRGVAAFSWDGAAWQPAAQARPSVATPYGVLAGVAMFNWSGTTWAAGAAVPSGETLDLSFLSGALDPRITLTRASTATYFDSSGTMQTAATNAPRLDYDPVTHAARGLLIEEARTNVMFPSTNWLAAQAPTGAVDGVVQNIGAGLAGSSNAMAIIGGSFAGAHQWYVSFAGAVSTQYTCSVYAKAAGQQFLILFMQGTSFPSPQVATFNLQTGAVTQPANGSARISNIGNGWYRCSVSDTTGTGALSCLATVAATPAGNLSYTGDSVNGAWVWGLQVEVGAFPTSYIPTTAATVTRAVDVATMPTAGWYSPTAGTAMAEALLPDNGNIGHRGLWELDGGVANVWLQSFVFSGTAAVAGYVDTTQIIIGSMTPGAPFKSAATHSAAGTTSVLNGVIGAGTAVVSTPATYTTLRFGVAYAPPPANFANGYIRRVRYWPRVLSNAELQSVTT